MRGHEDLEGLIPAYALSILDEEDREEVARHVAGCERCRMQLAQMRLIAGALPASAEQRDPPAYLKSRVLAAIGQERHAPSGARVASTNGSTTLTPAPVGRDGARAGDSAPVRTPARRPWRLAWPLVPGIVAAAALVAVAVAGFWTYRTNHRLDTAQDRLVTAEETLSSSYEALAIMAQADQKWQLTATGDAPQARGVLAYSSRRQVSSMVVWGVPISEDRSYSAWTSSGGQRATIGDMKTVDRGMWIVIPGDVRSLEAVGVTLRDADAPADAEGTVVLRLGIRD